LLAFVSNKTPKRKADALSRAKDCIRLMSYMAVSWPAGQQKQRLLENLLVEYGAKINGTAEPTPPTQAAPTKQETADFDFFGAFAQHDNEASMTRQMHFASAAPTMTPEQAIHLTQAMSTSIPAETIPVNTTTETAAYPFLPSSYPGDQPYLTSPVGGLYSPLQFGQHPSPPIQLAAGQDMAAFPDLAG
jgi:hypothetical protein